MLTLDSLLLFLPTIILIAIVPGPDFAVVSKVTLLNGRKYGQMAAIGISMGICLHTIFAILGISAIIAESQILFNILKYSGAIYLFYIGIKSLLQSYNSRELVSDSDNILKMNNKKTGYFATFRTGFLTNLLNPKAILFFIVLFPQFIDINESLGTQFLEMGAIATFVCLAWFLFLSYILSSIQKFFMNTKCQRWLLRCTGFIFIIFGVRILTQKVM